MKITGEESPEELREEARAIVLRQLAMMDRSRQQLLDAQISRGVPEEIAIEIVDRFEEVGLVDDEKFAAMLVRSRMAEKPVSRTGLARELSRKGIDREVADAALEEISPDDEREAAIALAEKKARSTRGLDDAVRRRRIYGALARRGFNPDQIMHALRSVLDDTDDSSY
ncbi:regulatory protein RecX [Flaviflexus salsibiostraticola]|uniref:Regulatory protein RecX n=1 Tax=Flaviflexus salsibiostraticola TaxID=1282737 RepID=A0A3Q8WS15_9ACTO|nr:regulatory protein RecX [Flaviflexus salsibiostraticola]AZN28920.1 regulatory protein RecX [Flaviflexus salsibiostraticola]